MRCEWARAAEPRARVPPHSLSLAAWAEAPRRRPRGAPRPTIQMSDRRPSIFGVLVREEPRDREELDKPAPTFSNLNLFPAVREEPRDPGSVVTD